MLYVVSIKNPKGLMMEIKVFVFEKHIFLIKNIDRVWQYHYVHGEKSTSIIGWGDEQWKYFVNYIAKSLGKETTDSYNFTLYVHPNLKQVIEQFTSLLANYKHLSLISFLTSYFKTNKTHHIEFNTTQVGFSKKGYHPFEKSKSVKYDLLSCHLMVSDEKKNKITKDNIISNSSKAIKFKIPVSQKDRRKLNSNHEEIIKEGSIFHITGSSFMVAVDNVSLFISEKYFSPHTNQSINKLVSNGDSVNIYCHRNSVSIELMSEGN